MNKTGYIYSLTCNNSKLIYYGSTTKPLNERLSQHIYDFNKKRSLSSKILFEWGNVKINMIEEIQFEDKIELIDRESYYIRNLKCVNKVIPNRTSKEWRENNKRTDYMKTYRKNNEEYRKKYDKERYNEIKEKKIQYNKIKINCNCGSKIRQGDLSKHKKTNKHQVYEFLKEIEDSNIII